MTYRERRLAKAERLRGFAETRQERDTDRTPAEQALDAIPFGQPILVGHHSERAHQNAIDKAEGAMRRRFDSLAKADRMAERADNIEKAAGRAIYDDDADAVEQLRERVAELEATRERFKTENAAFRKARKAELKAMTPYGRDQAVPHPGYELANLGGNISRNRKRLERLERQAETIASGSRGAGRTMPARYPGTCAECGADVERGEPMTYYRLTREVVCQSCS